MPTRQAGLPDVVFKNSHFQILTFMLCKTPETPHFPWSVTLLVL